MYLEFAEELHLHTSNCNGCQVNLRNQEGKLMCKAWRMDTTWARLGQHLNLQCRGGHAKGRGLGGANRTTLYTPEFAVGFASFCMRIRNMFTLLCLSIGCLLESRATRERRETPETKKTQEARS